MRCGETIRVKDMFGSNVLDIIAQCNGYGDTQTERYFIIIARTHSYLNGYRVVGWQSVLRELVALAVPAKLIDRRHDAESTAGGQYVHIPLTYPLSAAGLAKLLDAPPDEVRAALADLAVSVE